MSKTYGNTGNQTPESGFGKTHSPVLRLSPVTDRSPRQRRSTQQGAREPRWRRYRWVSPGQATDTRGDPRCPRNETVSLLPSTPTPPPRRAFSLSSYPERDSSRGPARPLAGPAGRPAARSRGPACLVLRGAAGSGGRRAAGQLRSPGREAGGKPAGARRAVADSLGLHAQLALRVLTPAYFSSVTARLPTCT